MSEELICNRFNKQFDEAQYRKEFNRIFGAGHERFSEPMVYIASLDKWVPKRDQYKYSTERKGMMFIDKAMSIPVTRHIKDKSKNGAPRLEVNNVYRKF